MNDYKKEKIVDIKNIYFLTVILTFLFTFL